MTDWPANLADWLPNLHGRGSQDDAGLGLGQLVVHLHHTQEHIIGALNTTTAECSLPLVS